ncbi:MAG: hypothetical protein VR66_05385 [Peptococcaceae bacterium BRH_c23]|nr:MAG: hypothetical protein VR66_05385 [Peptococcaceae bacterium BRH_c23]KJS81532.1 MAG: hypothetical protein JL57_26570 [Desulfosporosinus sp. BICA1-9]HBW35183.1 DUF2149 domain-containing protein [Desulfosporosinus sp.]
MLRKRGRKLQSEEDFNPLSSLANLADVMFVFSVGLIVALINVYNVSPSSSSSSAGKPKQAIVDVKQGKEMESLPQVDSKTGSGFEEMGTVFKDPKTGKLIMVQPVEEGK